MRPIEDYIILPDLAPITRYSPGSGLTLVGLNRVVT